MPVSTARAASATTVRGDRCLLGNDVERCYDVGVAGVHRLLELPRLRKAKVVTALAGMEGALASVVSGLVAAPVIAVPTDSGATAPDSRGRQPC